MLLATELSVQAHFFPRFPCTLYVALHTPGESTADLQPSLLKRGLLCFTNSSVPSVYNSFLLFFLRFIVHYNQLGVCMWACVPEYIQVVVYAGK